ncbi:MAG TPA: hypothetical protein VFX84_00815, partial [Candidatus Saccharimonadales bacterium]|nr:hypothetical protein [Candidatus Saccharimonadales bacterium]
MSFENRFRFDPHQPIPDGGIVLPDVFPRPDIHGYNGRLRLHDIIKGSVPRADGGKPPSILGWLKIAVGNGEGDYIDPSLDPKEQKKIR